MSEKVMIDGVDVSECLHYRGEMCCNEEELSLDCVKNKSCFYKQIIQLKAENERLKEKHKKLTCQILEISALNKTLVDACKNCDDIISYRKALEEIREIAENNMNCEGEKLPCPQSQDILDKINEVLG